MVTSLFGSAVQQILPYQRAIWLTDGYMGIAKLLCTLGKPFLLVELIPEIASMYYEHLVMAHLLQAESILLKV